MILPLVISIEAWEVAENAAIEARIMEEFIRREVVMNKTEWYGMMYGKAQTKINEEGQYEFNLR